MFTSSAPKHQTLGYAASTKGPPRNKESVHLNVLFAALGLVGDSGLDSLETKLSLHLVKAPGRNIFPVMMNSF